jgi:DNA polymerase-3 subunit beta
MQFLVSSTELLQNITIANNVISSNNTLPILDNFLFTVKDNTLYVSASDLETSIRLNINVDAKEEGNIAVPAKLLVETLKNFPEQPLNFFVNKEKHLVEISSQQGEYELAYLDGSDFPEEAQMEADNEIALEPDAILKAFNHTLFATGNDDLRPIMTGVHCEFSPSGSVFVATNAHKLVKYTRKDIQTQSHISFTLPKKPINVLKSVLNNKENKVNVAYNHTNARFSVDNVVLHCRFIEGKYPNYNAVIPQDNPNKLYIDRLSFLNSVKRVSVFSNKTTNQVQLNLTNNMLELKAEDLDFSNKADEKIPCVFDGEFKIAFDSKFLLELLQNIQSKDMVLEMSQPSRAGIIKPNDEDEANSDEDILMLIMPIMIS